MISGLTVNKIDNLPQGPVVGHTKYLQMRGVVVSNVGQHQIGIPQPLGRIGTVPVQYEEAEPCTYLSPSSIG